MSYFRNSQHSRGNTIVCPKLLLPPLFMIINKNTHTRERSIVEIDEMENILDIFMDKISLFTHKISQERTQILYGDL